MKEYLNNSNFLILLESLNIDIAKTSDSELESLYLIYQDNTAQFTKKMIDNFNAKLHKKDMIDSLFELNLDELTKEEILNVVDSLDKASLVIEYDTLNKKKFESFISRNKMVMQEFDISENNDTQYIKEVWVHEKTGFPILSAYKIYDATFKPLKYNLKKQIINKQLELGLKVYDFEINTLSEIDKIEYYNNRLDNAVKIEDYENAVIYRDIIKTLNNG